MTDNSLLNTDEAAALLGVSPRTLESWRVQEPHRGPEFVRIEGAVRYPKEALADYLTDSFNKPALPRVRAAQAAQALRNTTPTNEKEAA
jgi:hypothetical protein